MHERMFLALRVTAYLLKLFFMKNMFVYTSCTHGNVNPCCLKKWWPSPLVTHLAAPNSSFFPEIGAWWKHCAFAISTHPHHCMSLHQLALETCHAHAYYSNQCELIQQCNIELLTGCSRAMGNLREPLRWKNCLCSEPVTQKTRRENACRTFEQSLKIMHNIAWGYFKMHCAI